MTNVTVPKFVLTSKTHSSGSHNAAHDSTEKGKFNEVLREPSPGHAHRRDTVPTAHNQLIARLAMRLAEPTAQGNKSLVDAANATVADQGVAAREDAETRPANPKHDAEASDTAPLIPALHVDISNPAPKAMTGSRHEMPSQPVESAGSDVPEPTDQARRDLATSQPPAADTYSRQTNTGFHDAADQSSVPPASQAHIAEEPGTSEPASTPDTKATSSNALHAASTNDADPATPAEKRLPADRRTEPAAASAKSAERTIASPTRADRAPSKAISSAPAEAALRPARETPATAGATVPAPAPASTRSSYDRSAATAATAAASVHEIIAPAPRPASKGEAARQPAPHQTVASAETVSAADVTEMFRELGIDPPEDIVQSIASDAPPADAAQGGEDIRASSRIAANIATMFADRRLAAGSRPFAETAAPSQREAVQEAQIIAGEPARAVDHLSDALFRSASENGVETSRHGSTPKADAGVQVTSDPDISQVRDQQQDLSGPSTETPSKVRPALPAEIPPSDVGFGTKEPANTSDVSEPTPSVRTTMSSARTEDHRLEAAPGQRGEGTTAAQARTKSDAEPELRVTTSGSAKAQPSAFTDIAATPQAADDPSSTPQWPGRGTTARATPDSMSNHRAPSAHDQPIAEPRLTRAVEPSIGIPAMAAERAADMQSGLSFSDDVGTTSQTTVIPLGASGEPAPAPQPSTDKIAARNGIANTADMPPRQSVVRPGAKPADANKTDLATPRATNLPAESHSTSGNSNTPPADLVGAAVKTPATMAASAANSDSRWKKAPPVEAASVRNAMPTAISGTSASASVGVISAQGGGIKPDTASQPHLAIAALPRASAQTAAVESSPDISKRLGEHTFDAPSDQALTADTAKDRSDAGVPVDKSAAKPDASLAMPRLAPIAASVVTTIVTHPVVTASQAKPAATHLAQPAAVSSATHTLQIQLRPHEMGIVTATLRMADDRITVELATERIEAYEQLNKDSDTIVKALRGIGLQVDQVTVQPPQPTAASTKSEGGMPTPSSDGRERQSAQAGNSSGGGQNSQRGATPQGENDNGGLQRQTASPSHENRAGGSLVI